MLKLDSDRFRVAREKAGLTQRELADKIGLTRGAIALIEAGGSTAAENMARAAQVLNTPIEFFFVESVQNPVQTSGLEGGAA